jgi:hypothetical protein
MILVYGKKTWSILENATSSFLRVVLVILEIYFLLMLWGSVPPFESLGRQMALSREVHSIHEFGIMVPHK